MSDPHGKFDKHSLFHPERHMIRPIIYQVFTRYLILLCFSLLWDFFLNNSTLRRPVSTAFLLCASFLVIMAWLAYLRLDGVSVPKFDRRLFRRKKTPERAYGDLIDYTDEDIPTFDDLDDEEKDRCLFLSNLITAALFVITSFLRP
ncbi:MAG: hypothetical protein IJ242_11430 [Clostridia bacterium]|nr:hypothetical protein [Clostridia bacterium]